MFISSKNADTPVFDTDYILSGFTFRDLIDTANANGEDVAVTLDNMIKETTTNAREYFYINKYALNVVQRYEKGEKDWIKTDDFQYCKRVAPFRFKLIQAEAVDDKYIICQPEEIDLEDYINITPYGFTYKDETVKIVKSYYESTLKLNESYNEFDILQILAEMIYEVERFRSNKKAISADEADRFLKRYINEY